MPAPQYPRVLQPAIETALQTYPVVAVMGARQVGKSTLCQQLAEPMGMAFCTLDNSDVLAQAREDPEGLLADLGDRAFIDEAQRAPVLFLAIKAVVDQDQRPGRYLVSGSNQPAVRRELSDSLLGRAAYRTLRPLTLSELRLSETHAGWSFLFRPGDGRILDELNRRATSNGPLDWMEVVRAGGFPRVLAAAPAQQLRVLDDYIEGFARRDIRELIGIDSSDRFESFVRLAAARTGQELNYSGLSRDLGVAVNTIRRWMDALSRSFLVELVPSYSRNAGSRVIKAPKLFMSDVALALAAAREPNPSGFHLENLVASDLSVWKDLEPGRALHHWRLGSGQEVDFVLEENGQLLPVEMKSAAAVTSSDARHLRTFTDSNVNALRGVLLSNDPGIRVLAGRVIAAPWWAVV